MTLEEAIRHCHVKEEELRAEATAWLINGSMVAENNRKACLECAEDHRQLAEWLSELKSRRENKRPKGEWILDVEGSEGLAWFRCSECNAMEKLEKNNINAKFCWNCGAKMEVNDGKF